MSNRRNRPTNRWGCKPTEDVCVEHDRPLICRHGCNESRDHRCITLDAVCRTPECGHPIRSHRLDDGAWTVCEYPSCCERFTP